jgi:hypothetical protein
MVPSLPLKSGRRSRANDQGPPEGKFVARKIAGK